MSGHDPDDSGDDADGAHDDAGDERPDGWPDDWTTADDDAHAPTADPGEIPPADEPESPNPTESTEPTDPAESTGTANAESSLGERSTPEKPPAPATDPGPTIADDGIATWFLKTDNGAVVIVRDIVSSIAAVAAIGLLLFAVSGIWPPLVAVESGSMEPHMSKGDLVFIVDEERYSPPAAVEGTGVATEQSAAAADGYSKFGEHGDVIVYKPYGDSQTVPIIHRASFHVEKGENWVDRANPQYLGSVDSCQEVPRDMCPAPYDGFITKGDANPTYDQVGDQSTIVKSEWIRGKAQVRIPLLGWIRLEFANLATAGPTGFGDAGVIVVRFSALGLAAGAAVVSRHV